MVSHLRLGSNPPIGSDIETGCDKTTARKPADVSPFALTYGMEAVIPTEISLPTIRTTTSNQRMRDQ